MRSWPSSGSSRRCSSSPPTGPASPTSRSSTAQRTACATERCSSRRPALGGRAGPAGIVGLSDGVARRGGHGRRCRLIADIDKSYGPAAGLELVEELTRLRDAGLADLVIGIGADSTELGVDMRAFAPAFEAARRAGFRRTCHAGEAVGVGPDNIRIALDILGAERIDHGVAIVEDQALIERVAHERVPLTVCPASNIAIANRFQRSGPLGMREAGLLMTVNTDDPAMMSWDLGREYQALGTAMGYDLDELARIAVEGIESTWLDASDRAVLVREFEDALGQAPMPD
jgi:adenosine deaminase